jgi:hypothetical protein
MAKMSPKAKASLDKVVQRFEEGDLSPMVNAALIELPEDAPASKWSYNNKVLATAQSGVVDCRGYRQWKAVGRQVQKGTHASWIYMPRTKKNNETGEYELKGWLMGAVHPYTNTQVIEGQEEIAFEYKLKEPPPLLEVAERLGLNYQIAPTLLEGYNATMGWFRQSDGTLTMGADDIRTFFHELAHAAHAQFEDLLEVPVVEKETIADLTAAVLCDIYGVDRTGNVWNYIKFFNPEDPMDAIRKAMTKVGKVLEVILEE